MTLIKLELWGWRLTFTGSLPCVENLPLSATLGWEEFSEDQGRAGWSPSALPANSFMGPEKCFLIHADTITQPLLAI